MSKQSSITATDLNLNQLLKDNKFSIDYFQREYRWQDKHMIQLVTDLTSAFLQEYTVGDEPPSITNYNSYYLGPIIINNKDGINSLIDGQQRLTSITLFLIFLNHLQQQLDVKKVALDSLIYSDNLGITSFNIKVPERDKCMLSLYKTGEYELTDDDNESSINLVERYEDIHPCFPDDLRNDNLQVFIYWLINKVILVQITAFTDDNAYTIFETMNDRGLSLISTEMLKGFILSRISNTDRRNHFEKKWKTFIQKLHAEYSEDEDQYFFMHG